MKTNKVSNQFTITLILLVLLILFVIYFLFFTPVSPLKGDLRAEPSANPIRADGIWGVIGFYERPADNNLTYFLMLTFILMSTYKIIKTTRASQKLFFHLTGKTKESRMYK